MHYFDYSISSCVRATREEVVVECRTDAMQFPIVKRVKYYTRLFYDRPRGGSRVGIDTMTDNVYIIGRREFFTDQETTRVRTDRSCRHVRVRREFYDYNSEFVVLLQQQQSSCSAFSPRVFRRVSPVV